MAKRGSPEDYFYEEPIDAESSPRGRGVVIPLQDPTFPNGNDTTKLIVFGGIVIAVCFFGFLAYLVTSKK